MIRLKELEVQAAKDRAAAAQRERDAAAAAAEKMSAIEVSPAAQVAHVPNGS